MIRMRRGLLVVSIAGRLVVGWVRLALLTRLVTPWVVIVMMGRHGTLPDPSWRVQLDCGKEVTRKKSRGTCTRGVGGWRRGLRPAWGDVCGRARDDLSVPRDDPRGTWRNAGN